jgi:serine/threonine protein kinase
MDCPQCDTINPEDSKFCKKCASPLSQPDDTLSFHSKKVLAIPEVDLAIGTIFKEKYKLIEKLGGGGMGIVYKAEDMRLKRHVALKFLPSRLTKDPEFKQRFIQEAQAASVLEHQNICTIHEIDETKEGRMYIAMAYYPGESLKKKIKRGSVPLNQTLDCVTQIAQGLAKAHSQGIIHRDIKPANVMDTSEGIMKIVDFGLAKLVHQTKLTTTSSIIGTPSYMSPEQAQGEVVDHRADIWALGVVFYELLTGESPFKGKNEQAVLFSIINKSPLPPSELKRDIPDEVERIILKCLRKQPKDRYQSADRLLLGEIQRYCREKGGSEKRDRTSAGYHVGSRNFRVFRDVGVP